MQYEVEETMQWSQLGGHKVMRASQLECRLLLMIHIDRRKQGFFFQKVPPRKVLSMELVPLNRTKWHWSHPKLPDVRVVNKQFMLLSVVEFLAPPGALAFLVV